MFCAKHPVSASAFLKRKKKQGSTVFDIPRSLGTKIWKVLTLHVFFFSLCLILFLKL